VTLTLVLPWFPILLGVGIGGRLLGRARGTFVGVLCALFWVVLVQASVGPALWSDPWTVVTIVTGATAIASVGRWSAQTSSDLSAVQTSACAVSGDEAEPAPDGRGPVVQRLCAAMDQFDDWLDEHRDDRDPWPSFDEFIRSMMFQCCDATHVKPYRLATEGEELVPLHEPDPLVEVDRVPARRGVLGHVVTTGRSYLAGDTTHGELVERLAGESGDTSAWCFAIRQGTQRLGAVLVGQLGIAPDRNKSVLQLVERMITHFWCMLHETMVGRSAVQNDPVSGLPTRAAFLRAADQSLRESYHLGEPLALVVIVLEGLRELTDAGRWNVADDVVREASQALRRKVRMDDCLGRLEGHGFLVLLRRVDSELASLIVRQLMARLKGVCGDDARWRASVCVRCGLAGSGMANPDLRTLLARALAQSRRARIEGVPIASDLGATPICAEAIE
jgi:diguanylate cyclase (GGDEF)-like protein